MFGFIIYVTSMLFWPMFVQSLCVYSWVILGTKQLSPQQTDRMPEEKHHSWVQWWKSFWVWVVLIRKIIFWTAKLRLISHIDSGFLAVTFYPYSYPSYRFARVLVHPDSLPLLTPLPISLLINTSIKEQARMEMGILSGGFILLFTLAWNFGVIREFSLSMWLFTSELWIINCQSSLLS